MTLATVLDLLSWLLIIGGAYFIVVGAIGLIRLPDIFTRLHALSLIDSLGALLLILGLMIQAGPTLIALKLAFIYILIFFTGPVATHALAQAALHSGIEPELKEDRRAARQASVSPAKPVATVVDPSGPLPPSDTTE